jgi:hypothetical protein
VDTDGTEAERTSWASDDEALLDRLSEIVNIEDVPPAILLELAKQSFGLRMVEFELATLTADSDVDTTAVVVRDGRSERGPRLLTFESSTLTVEIEVSGSGRHRRLFGQIDPPGVARIEVRQPSTPQPRSIDTDDRGRFVVENLAAGPISLTCHQSGRLPVVTEWTGLD